MTDRSNLDFMLQDWLRLDDVLSRSNHFSHDLSGVSAYLDLAERVAAEHFLPHYKKADQIEPRLTEDGVEVLPEVAAALGVFADAGFLAAPFAEELGGLRVPELVNVAGLSIFMEANLATSGYGMLTIGNARLITAHGSPAQVDAFVRPQLSGEAFGTMCLSEPQAGSSLADIRTRAEADGDSPFGPRYRLTGNKMWISGGDQNISANIFHLVLAKIPQADGTLPEGTKGISLFIVPKILVDADGNAGERNDVVVAGLNHKMGYRGTSNCLLNFGEGRRHAPEGRAGAIGYRVVQPGEGLAIMFHMMNEARINVGLGAAAVAVRSHLLSVRYARERAQGRLGRGGGQVALIEHPDVRRMLLAQKCYAEGALALILYTARLIDDRDSAAEAGTREEADILLGLITPAAKTWTSEWGLAANDIAIQVHGGYGYTRDFDVEQLYRDNRLNPIHEGTTGIQGIDFVGRKVAMDGGRALDLLGGRIKATCAAALDPRLAGHAATLSAQWTEFVAASTRLAGAELQAMLANSTEMLRVFGHVVVGWLWLDQARAALAGGSPLAAAKLACCEHYFRHEMPRAACWLAIADRHFPVSADAGPEVFGNVA